MDVSPTRLLPVDNDLTISGNLNSRRRKQRRILQIIYCGVRLLCIFTFAKDDM